MTIGDKIVLVAVCVVVGMTLTLVAYYYGGGRDV